MRHKFEQLSFDQVFFGVTELAENNKPAFISLLDQYLDFSEIIPITFRLAFYKFTGRKHRYHPENFLKAFVLQHIFGFHSDSLLIAVLNCSSELRDYCGFSKVPDASQFTRFKQQYVDHIGDLFEHLVELTEPICREIDSHKNDYLLFDTTGFEGHVAENNDKFLTAKLKAAQKWCKDKDNVNPYQVACGSLPDAAKANADFTKQYVDGHFCYAVKAGILTNGFGIIRGITIFDDDFKKRHPEIVTPKTDNPDKDKEISDSVALVPVLHDFYNAHPTFHYHTFIGDAAFDSYAVFSALKNDFGFERACIPINNRNRKQNKPSEFDSNGTPVCPLDKTPFTFAGICRGKHRSPRFKWVCPQSVANGSKRICTCPTPCTDSSYGRCIYTYPEKEFRMYPGIPRGTEHWDNLYHHRVNIERTISTFKDVYGLSAHRTLSTSTIKADFYLAGITQLIGVLLADALNKPELCKSIRKLMKAA